MVSSLEAPAADQGAWRADRYGREKRRQIRAQTPYLPLDGCLQTRVKVEYNAFAEGLI